MKKKDNFIGERALVLPKSIIKELEDDKLSAILHITDIGYYPNARNHYIDRTKAIDQNVFIYCTQGEGWFKLKGETYHVEPNHYFILPAGLPHSYGTVDNNPWTIYWIHFKGSYASCFVPQSPKPIEIKPGIYSRINNRNELFEEILHTLEMGYSHKNLLYANSIFFHYMGTLRYIQQYRNAQEGNDGELDIVTTAIHFMKENIEKHLNLQDITTYIGYSPSHFSFIFKEKTGYTPIAYLNQLKIQHACHLLNFSKIKINQVCYKIGIEDSYYFSRLFKKVMGMSPKQYKNLKKG